MIKLYLAIPVILLGVIAPLNVFALGGSKLPPPLITQICKIPDNFRFTRNRTVRSRGADVNKLRCLFLGDRNNSGSVEFDSKLEKAVKVFQQAENIPVNGKIDLQTRKKLNSLITTLRKYSPKHLVPTTEELEAATAHVALSEEFDTRCNSGGLGSEPLISVATSSSGRDYYTFKKSKGVKRGDVMYLGIDTCHFDPQALLTYKLYDGTIDGEPVLEGNMTALDTGYDKNIIIPLAISAQNPLNLVFLLDGSTIGTHVWSVEK